MVGAGPADVGGGFGIRQRAGEHGLGALLLVRERQERRQSIDQRLRLAFSCTAPVDAATMIGAYTTGTFSTGHGA